LIFEKSSWNNQVRHIFFDVGRFFGDKNMAKKTRAKFVPDLLDLSDSDNSDVVIVEDPEVVVVEVTPHCGPEQPRM
jgi:hypothetical protein